MKIAICDDDQQELLYITQLVNDYLNCNFSGPLEVHKFERSMELLDQIERGHHFDIFLLDVVMPHMNGIKLAMHIRSTDEIAKIIFLTSTPEFAVESYSVGAFNYLLKPIQKNRLFSVLEKACSHTGTDLKPYIVVKTQTSLCKIFLHELVYVEVIGRTVYFHQKNGIMLESTITISQVEAILLVHKSFIKPHRSYIVNLEYIKTLAPATLTTLSNQSIPVSRTAFKTVKQAYIDYSFEEET